MSSSHRLRDMDQQQPLLDRQEEVERSFHSEVKQLWFIQDCCGMVCAFITWFLVFFADFVVTFVNPLFPPPCSQGAVPKGNANKKYLESLQLKPGNVIYKCPKCCSIKPERAHHCSICERCIRKMDHHCPWVNNCVGEKNQRFFVLFTMYIAVISGHALALCGYHFITCIRVQWRECSNFSPPATMMLLIFLCMEGLLFLTFTAIMFCTQLHSICNYETEIERLRNEKPTWERRTCWAGLRSVFGGRPSLLWMSPFAGLRLSSFVPKRTWRGGAEFSV
ncbi:palmitoyltransferase ZDHHC7-like [Limanda limanda]|uniref:palmitoyltransferase ZDHHC7-like n=1 Tax=Limanda limanda TaxID=27771 RepID=UPI0029C6D70B|nr:palmitoyltransferase ZDHHC7-like [Limanda limanda]